MLRSMDSMEITEWFAYFLMKSEGERPKGQTPKEARAVLDSMVKAKRRHR